MMQPISLAVVMSLSLLAPTVCVALGLGNASTKSRIGAPLRIEIPLQVNESDKPAPSCFRMAPAPADYTDDIPWLRSGKLQVEQRAGSAVLVVSSPANNHPAIRLGIQLVCDNVQLRRDYTLLLDPPSETEILAVQTPRIARESASSTVAEPRSRAADRKAGSEWVTGPGETPANIAQALLPGNPAAQRQLARTLLKTNSGRAGTPGSIYGEFEPGSQIVIPPLPLARPTRPPERYETASAGSATPPQAPSSRSDQTKRKDRLLVQESGNGGNDGLRLDTSIASRRELSEKEREQLRSEMQLIAVLDEKIARQIELTERIRQLEALQQRLQADADRLDAQLRVQSQTLASRTGDTAPPSISIQRATQPDDAARESNWMRVLTSTPTLALTGTLLASLVGLAFWRRRSQNAERDDLETVSEFAEPTRPPRETLVEPLTQGDIWPEKEEQRISPKPIPAPRTLDSFSVAPEGPMSVLQLGDDEKEHDSAVELAEIMMSFGRVHGAAQTLAEFIRSKPRQAVEPWIKLLEVYRAADMRVEFDALTSQLNKTFNVKPPSWDGFEIATANPESLEGYPHIMETLQSTWGKRECQQYLHTLLRDNRQGTRQGFPLAVVDEILLLISILEHTLQSSGYKPAKPAVQATMLPPQSPGEPKMASPTQPSSDVAINQNPADLGFMETKLVATQAFSKSRSSLDFNLDAEDQEHTLHIDLDNLNEFDFDLVGSSKLETGKDPSVQTQTGLSNSTKST